MTSEWLLLLLLLSAVRAKRRAGMSCPAACVLCSENAVICHRLGHVIDVPDTTRALLLTDGSISTVPSASLSDLSNITLIGLSHNRVSVLGEDSFRHLPLLQTLMLDHNLLTSQALHRGALSNLTQLQVLALGHNLISMIHADWFQGTKALRSLKLEGNLLTSLDPGSFPLNDLRDLESLDLSDNFLQNLDRNSFRGLVALRRLDLSRNRLSSAHPETFSYLSWLTSLNLDLNPWNCSCQLLDLAAFLSLFLQQPDQTLYNGRRMVCVSAENPSVTTVLELNDANCVPSNQNITVQVETRSSVTPQVYAQDLAITAVICFAGGVSLTLLVVLICYQVSCKKKLKESERQKREKEEGDGTTSNYFVNHHDVSWKRRELFVRAGPTRDAEATGHSHSNQSRPRAESNHFWCPDCRAEGLKLNPMKLANRSRGMEAEEDRERRRVRTMMMMMMDEREKCRMKPEILHENIPNKLSSNGHSSSPPWRGTFLYPPENLVDYQSNRETDQSYGTDVEETSAEMLNCGSCHRTYRPSEQNTRAGRTHHLPRDHALFGGFPPQHGLGEWGGESNYNQFDMKNLSRETRNVRFDLKSQKTWREEGQIQGKDRREEAVRNPREKERATEKKHKAKGLKVKLNSNLLRKTKVHPKRKLEHLEKIKKSKDKRQDGNDQEEMEATGSSGRKTKASSKRVKKTEGLIGHDEQEEEDEGGGEGKKNKSSEEKQKKSTEGDQGETITWPAPEDHTAREPEGSVISQGQSSLGLSSKGSRLQVPTSQGPTSQSLSFQGLTSHGPTSLGPSFQGPRLQGPTWQGLSPPYQGADSVLADAQSLSQQLDLAGSQLTGRNLSLQGGNSLLNILAPESNALLPSGPNNTVMALSGTPDSFGVNLTSPAVALLPKTGHTNPLQANVIQTPLPLSFGLPTGQPGGLIPTIPANTASAIQPLSQASPLEARLNPHPDLAPGLQTGKGLQELSSGPQGLQSITVPTQLSLEEAPSGGILEGPGPVNTVENLSNNNSHTESGPGPSGSTMGVLAEGPAVQVPDSSIPATSVVTAAAMASPTAAAAALLQQEYLSQEGGSSPRRKLRLVLPEKTSDRQPTALERKIR